ncbi:MAG: SEC-C domain-containing protein [Actinobacteria bacterium]|nr:SEC-C domain-containing protein [Actinomycetota bacterium]
MRQIPAKCGYCGYLFPSGYGIDPGVTGAEFSMNGWENAPVSTPCPMCGRRRGRVLAGEFEFVKDTVKFLSGPESTVRDLERLAAFLEDLQGTDATTDEIQERAESAGLSNLVKPLLANRPARMELATWLALLVATVTLWVTLKSAGSTDEPEPSQAIYNYGDQYNITVQAPMPTDGNAVVKAGRNDPCRCGSGKKFKKCHGDPTREVPDP